MNTAGDISELTLNDTDELLSPLRDRSNLSFHKLSGGSDYSDTFEDDYFHTSVKQNHQYGSELSCTDSHKEFPSPQLASTHRRPDKITIGTRHHRLDRPTKTYTRTSGIAKERKIKSLKKTEKEKNLDSTQDLINTESDKNNPNLSIWENWLVAKLQSEREELKRKKEEERMKKEKERLEKIEKEEKKMKADAFHKEWCEHRELKLKMQKQNEARKKKVEKELEMTEQARKDTRAEQEYLKWMEKKKQENSQKIKKEKELKQRLEEEKKERKSKSEKKFEEWLEKVKSKPRSPIKGKQGIIIDYPEPTYKNPAPWVGPLADKVIQRPRPSTAIPASRVPAVRPSKPKTKTSTPKSGVFLTNKPSCDKGVLIMRPLSASSRCFDRIPLDPPPRHNVQ